MHIQMLQSLTPDQSIKLAEFKAVELLCAALKFISANVPSDKAAENPIVMLSEIARSEFRLIRDQKKGSLFGIQLNVTIENNKDVANIVDYIALLYRQKDGQFYPIEYHQMNKIICENEKILKIIKGAHFKGLVDNKNIEGWNPLLQAMKRGAVAAVNTARSNPFGSIVSPNNLSR